MRLSSVVALALLYAGKAGAQTPAPHGPVQPKDTCRIQGRVFSSTTGAPIARVKLELKPRSELPPPPDQPVTGISTTSRPDGTFVIDAPVPGVYNLLAERAGYVTQFYGGRWGDAGAPIGLNAGDKGKEIAFPLHPVAILAGRVYDQDRDPVAHAAVYVLRLRYLSGRKMVTMAAMAPTAADGSFSASGLLPGRYFLYASPTMALELPLSMRNTSASPPEPEGTAATFFPNGAELSQAAPVDVQAGSETRNLDVRLRRTSLYRVAGRVVAAGAPVPEMGLMLSPKDTNGLAGIARRFFAHADGAFEIGAVPPGTYEIRSMRASFNETSERTKALVGKVEVTVADRNLENLLVELGPGAELRGAIRLEEPDPPSPTPPASGTDTAGARPSPSLGGIGVTLRDADQTGMDSKAVQTGAHGQFSITGIVPGSYLFNFRGVPAGTYLKSVTVGGQDATWKPFTLPLNGVISVEALLSAGAAEVSGIVRDADGKPVPGAWITAWTTAADSDAIPVHVGVSGPGGAFRLPNLMPGAYRLAAWEEIDPGLAGARSFCSRFTGRSTSVDIGRNEKSAVDVKLVDKAAIEAEVQKLW